MSEKPWFKITIIDAVTYTLETKHGKKTFHSSKDALVKLVGEMKWTLDNWSEAHE
jgi:hypothetical protein